MFYEVTIPEGQLAILEALRGSHLDAVHHNGWSAHLQLSDRVAGILPEEEATPDPEHPTADVERPKIVFGTDTDFRRSRAISEGRVGVIRGINIISTLVRFSAVKPFPEQMFGKTVFPPVQDIAEST